MGWPKGLKGPKGILTSSEICYMVQIWWRFIWRNPSNHILFRSKSHPIQTVQDFLKPAVVAQTRCLLYHDECCYSDLSYHGFIIVLSKRFVLGLSCHKIFHLRPTLLNICSRAGCKSCQPLEGSKHCCCLQPSVDEIMMITLMMMKR